MKFQHIHVKIWKMKVRKREEKHKEMHKRKLELLPTSELVSLWKENLSILESSQCNEGCQAWPRKNQTSMQKQNL